MSKQIARVLPLFLVLMLVFAAGGCLVAVEDVDPAAGEARVNGDLTPEELRERVIAAWRGVETFQYDTEMTMQMTTIIDGEKTDMQTRMLQHSAIDIPHQRMMTTMTTEATMPPMPGVVEEVMAIEIATYWVDGMTYMKMTMPDMPAMPGMPPEWIKFEMPWVCPIKQMVTMLEASEFEILRVEQVNGVESYLIRLTPDIGQMLEILMRGMMMPGLAPDPEAIMMDIYLQEMLEMLEMSINQWIARDTYLPVKEEWEMTMVLEGMEMEMTMESLYHSFNQPVTIELPPEAAEAIDMGTGLLPIMPPCPHDG